MKSGMEGPSNGKKQWNRRQVLGAFAGALAGFPERAEANDGIESPFGLQQIPDPNSIYAPQWEKLQEVMQKDDSLYEQGETHAARKLREIIEHARMLGGFDSIRNLKASLQRAVKPETMPQALGEGIKEWHSPLSSFEDENDCKGYAALEYFGFGKLGPEWQRQILIVKSPKNEYHAVDAIRFERRWYISDNLLSTVVPDSEFFVLKKKDWVPVAAFDERGTWKFSDGQPVFAERS